MRLPIIFAAAALLAPAVAHAQAAAPAIPQSVTKATFLANTQAEFTQLDVNKDGAVSTAEIDTARAAAVAAAVERRTEAMFSELDTDKNGQLTKAEFAKGLKPSRDLPPSPLLAMDANKDGRITAAEYKAGMEARFSRTDANKDGVVTQAEARSTAPSR